MVRDGEVLGHAGWLAALLLVLGVVAASPARGESPVGLPAGQMSGDWVGLVACPGVPEITLALSTSGAGTVRATVTVAKQETIVYGAPPPLSFEMTGEYDERSGRLDLAQSAGNYRTVNALHGVVDGGSGRLVAWPEIPRLVVSHCGPAVLGQGKFRAEVKRLEGAVARWPKDMKKFDKAFQKLRQKYKNTPEVLCDAQVTGWMDQIGFVHFSRRWGQAFTDAQNATLNAAAHLALHDSGFRPHFGKDFAELSPKELGILAAHTNACKGQRVQAGGGGGADLYAISLLHTVGKNQGGEPRLALLAHNMALDAAFAWTKRAQARLNEIPRAGAPEAEIDAIQSAGALVKDSLWPDDRQSLETAVTTARGGWAKGALMAALAPLIEEAPQSVEAVERLAAYTRENDAYGKLSPADRAEIDALVKRSVDASVVPAAERFAAEASGGEGAREMANWRLLHPVLWETMDPMLRTPVHKAFGTRFPALVEALVASEREGYEQGWVLRSRRMDALAYAVQYEKGFTERYELTTEHLGWLELWREPPYRAFTADRAARRRQALAQSGDELRAAVASTESEHALERILDTYLLPIDRSLPEGRGLASAIASRRTALTPFRAYRGGAYLDAVYQEDRESLEELDAAFRAPYVHFVEGMTSALPSGSLAMTMGAMMSQAAYHASLIGPVIAAYLLNYPTVYERCMEPDADTVERRIPREWVTKDLFGNTISSSRMPDIVHQYKVNKRFTDVFMRINADYAPDAGLIDLLMKAAGVTHGAIGTADVGLGVTQMMQDFPCDGPVIARFEKNMLRYYYE